MDYRNIMVAIDNSDYSTHGVELGIEIAQAFEGSITGAHAYAAKLHDRRFRQMEGGLPERYRFEGELEKQRDIHDSLITKGLKIITDSYFDAAEGRCRESGLSMARKSLEGKNYKAHLEVAKGIAKDQGVEVGTTLLAGKPYGAILGYAWQEKPDLLILGKVGVHQDEGLDIGSNAENLLRLAPCHVLLTTRRFVPPVEAVAEQTVSWTKEAEARMERVPSYVRNMAKVVILRYAQDKGHTVGTNGILLDNRMVRRLMDSGVSGVGISLDSIDPSLHDTFRGVPGAWRRAIEAIERCRHHGLAFQIHHSVMSFNWADVWEMVEFADFYGARVVNFFFMVCTGRGEKLTDITPEQYEEVLSTLIDLQAKYPGMMIRARCAPHFKRIAYQKDPNSPITKAEGYLGGGCLAGSHYCRIAPDGEITPCPYMPLSVGNVRHERFPEIWENARVFLDLRAPQLKGKCGGCEYEDLCGGCRARPYASHGDYLDEDLWCQYKPAGGEKIGAAEIREGINRVWTKEAEERLNRLPFFLWSMIRGNVEKYAKEQGISSITPELLDELRRKRFGEKMPEMPFARSGDTLLNSHSANSEGCHTELSRVSPERLPWTREASKRLDAIPEFMREIFREVAEEFARDKGHLEVNIEVWDRLEEISGEKLEVRSKRSEVGTECESEKEMEWTQEALREIGDRYIEKPKFARDFMAGIIKEDIERFARSKGISRIDREVLHAALEDGEDNVEWLPEAWERLQNAPDFIRSGIRKAAESRARRNKVSLITTEILTQFRNMAMMKAVKRIKTLGYQDLTFDAFDYAKENFKHIRDSVEAQERLDEIREHVTSKGKIGLMDKEMLSKMKEFLRK